MSSISFNIVIPEYYGEYEAAMERLFAITNKEEIMFTFFFARRLDKASIENFAKAIYNSVHPDAVFSTYNLKGHEQGIYGILINELSKDLVSIFTWMSAFYRTQPFVQRLLEQASYNNKVITAVKMIPDGVTVCISEREQNEHYPWPS